MNTLADCVVLAICAAPPILPQATRPAILQDVGIDQHLDAQVPLDAQFRDESGRRVSLADLLHGRPAILTLNYYRCPMLCTLILNGLVASMKTLAFDAGRDFDIITISIDPHETPDLAAAKKREYIRHYGRPNAATGWHFLTGDEPQIRRVADAVGFHYKYDAQHDQFAHASGIIVLTPQGRVSRYFYGVEFVPRDLRLGLIEASHNKIGTLSDQIMLFCFHYDPLQGRYGLAIVRALQIAGVLTVVTIVSGITVLVRRQRSPSDQRSSDGGKLSELTAHGSRLKAQGF